MSKRRGQPNQDQLNRDLTGKRSRPVQKHLYLVLDDWEKGFSIHKVDAGNLEHGDTSTDEDTRVGLPGSAVLRLAAPVLRGDMNFTALGSNIFIVTNPSCGQTPALVYDTKTAGLTIGPRLPSALLGGFDISLAVGDMLYALISYHGNQQHSFEVMSSAPTGNREPSFLRPSMEWSWQSVPSPPPFNKDEWITSYAVHPDGRTIFMSAHDDNYSSLAKVTYSFDTQHCEWRWHGEWVLPFQGQGYFDSELDAWVGLHKDGYICSCQGAAGRSPSSIQPDRKMMKEKLTCSDHDRHLGATLVHVGNTRFCLIECVVREGVEYEVAFGDRGGCLLRMTTFGLKYSHKGELQITNHRITNSYVVSKHLPSFSPVAFWM